MASFFTFVQAMHESRVLRWDGENGTCIWLPLGLRVRTSFENHVVRLFELAGFERVEMPALIEHESFSRQRGHAGGLAP